MTIHDWVVRVPASSANLGPGFDVLGMALSLHAYVGVTDGAATPTGARVVDEHHPATIAYRSFGGANRIWVRSPIPAARGLGFSGAVRVGGAAAAAVEQSGVGALDDTDVRADVASCAIELETHADNVAASVYGGVVAAAGDEVIRIPLAIDPDIAVWIPDDATTATKASRSVLAPEVSREDAVYNLGRLSLLIISLVTGDIERLGRAAEDRMHQPARLAAQPASQTALEAAREAGCDAAWLSGSGPAVAALCARGQAPTVVAAWNDTAARHAWSGRATVLRIDNAGAVVAGTEEIDNSSS